MALLAVSCQQKQEKQRYADVDTSSNEVLHLTDPDDFYYSLEDLVEAHPDKFVYVHFWNSYETNFKETMRAMEKLEKDFKGKDLVILNICLEPVMRPFLTHLDITVLENNYIARNFPEATFFDTYDFIGLPRFMIYDRKGKLIDQNAMSPLNENLEPTLQALIETP